MEKNRLDRLIKVREVSESGNALTRWLAIKDVEIPTGQAVIREGGQAIFEQEAEPTNAQPGDFWIQED